MSPGGNLYVGGNISQDSLVANYRNTAPVGLCKRSLSLTHAIGSPGLSGVLSVSHYSSSSPPTLLPPYTGTRRPPAATCSAPTNVAPWEKENLPFPAFPEITGLTLIVGDWPVNHVWTNSRSMEVIVDCVARATSYVHSWTKRLELFKFEL